MYFRWMCDCSPKGIQYCGNPWKGWSKLRSAFQKKNCNIYRVGSACIPDTPKINFQNGRTNVLGLPPTPVPQPFGWDSDESWCDFQRFGRRSQPRPRQDLRARTGEMVSDTQRRVEQFYPISKALRMERLLVSQEPKHPTTSTRTEVLRPRNIISNEFQGRPNHYQKWA